MVEQIIREEQLKEEQEKFMNELREKIDGAKAKKPDEPSIPITELEMLILEKGKPFSGYKDGVAVEGRTILDIDLQALINKCKNKDEENNK